MEYTEQEILNEDIDWIIPYGKYILHVASAGGNLPNVIKRNKDLNNEVISSIRNLTLNGNVKQLLRSLNKDYGIEVNPSLEEILNLDNHVNDYRLVLKSLGKIKPENQNTYNDDSYIIKTYIEKLYIPSFIYFAERGLMSFDRSISKEINGNENKYHWVARPRFVIPEIPNILREFDQFKLNDEIDIDNLLKGRDVNIVDLINRIYN